MISPRIAVVLGLCFWGLPVLQGAALVNCTSPDTNVSGSNISCHLGVNGVPVNPQNPTFSQLFFSANSSSGISNGTYQESGLAFFPAVPLNNTGPYPMSVSAVWDDIFTLPNSPAGDVLQVTAYLGGCGTCAPDSQPGSGLITVGPQPAISDNVICDINQSCSPNTYLVSADGINMVETQGSYSYSFNDSTQTNPGGQSRLLTFESTLTIARFLSDGVTPDPFVDTPEPGTGWLFAAVSLGLVVFTEIRFRTVKL